MLLSFDAVDLSGESFVNYTANNLFLLFLNLFYLFIIIIIIIIIWLLASVLLS